MRNLVTTHHQQGVTQPGAARCATPGKYSGCRCRYSRRMLYRLARLRSAWPTLPLRPQRRQQCRAVAGHAGSLAVREARLGPAKHGAKHGAKREAQSSSRGTSDTVASIGAARGLQNGRGAAGRKGSPPARGRALASRWPQCGDMAVLIKSLAPRLRALHF